jgi:hypothetical protein
MLQQRDINWIMKYRFFWKYLTVRANLIYFRLYHVIINYFFMLALFSNRPVGHSDSVSYHVLVHKMWSKRCFITGLSIRFISRKIINKAFVVLLSKAICTYLCCLFKHNTPKRMFSM